GLELAAGEPVAAHLLVFGGLDRRRGFLCRRRLRLYVLGRNGGRSEGQRGGEGERSQDAAHEVVSRSGCGWIRRQYAHPHRTSAMTGMPHSNRFLRWCCAAAVVGRQTCPLVRYPGLSRTPRAP